MILTKTLRRRVAALIVLCGSLAWSNNTQASGGATDTIPGASKSGLSTGGGGGGGGGGKRSVSTPTPVPTPAPTPTPILTAPLTFSAAGPINGVVPICTGSYRVDPYYPTLSRLTVYVQVSSFNEPDGSLLHVNVVGVGGIIYPFTSNTISIVRQAGTCTLSAYITPGTKISGVIVSDASGAPILAGN